MNIHQQFLTPAQVADKLQVTRRTVYNWLRSGKLRGAKLSGDNWLTPEDALGEFLGGPPVPVAGAAPSSGLTRAERRRQQLGR